MKKYTKYFTPKKIAAGFIFVGGFISAMHFWQVRVEQVGLLDYLIGLVIYALCSGVSKAMSEDKD
jgi:hypothetical protein